jgi:hypothetical protein
MQKGFDLRLTRFERGLEFLRQGFRSGFAAMEQAEQVSGSAFGQ